MVTAFSHQNPSEASFELRKGRCQTMTAGTLFTIPILASEMMPLLIGFIATTLHYKQMLIYLHTLVRSRACCPCTLTATHALPFCAVHTIMLLLSEKSE